MQITSHAFARTVASEPTSSSEVRDAIISQHQGLRARLARTVEIANHVAHAEMPLDALRAQARSLYQELAAHMELEERMLPAALSDVIGWGSVLHAQMTAEHERQRATLGEALVALSADEASPIDLSADILILADAIAHDMEVEESNLLQADLDAIATDGRGG